VPEPLNQGIIKENLAFVHGVLLEYVIEGHQEVILELDQLPKVTVRKVLLIVNAREKHKHQGVQ